jgi:hypothetical protein
VREGKKVRQQVIATLGRLDLLEVSGQLERLMRSGLHHCESGARAVYGVLSERAPVVTKSTLKATFDCALVLLLLARCISVELQWHCDGLRLRHAGCPTCATTNRMNIFVKPARSG